MEIVNYQDGCFVNGRKFKKLLGEDMFNKARDFIDKWYEPSIHDWRNLEEFVRGFDADLFDVFSFLYKSGCVVN